MLTVSELKPDEFVFAQTLSEVSNKDGFTLLKWIDGWTFTFPSNLTVDKISEYMFAHSG